MEKQSKPRSNNILKFLPRAASAIYFHNVPFSPNKDHRKPPHGGTAKGFSGPIISIIPDEARRKPRNNDGFGTQEPTSPKISCMGQIKHKKNVNSKPAGGDNRRKNKRVPVIPAPEKPVFFTPREGKNKDSSGRSSSVMKRMFSTSKTAARKSSSDEKAAEDYRAPALGQLKRFSSGRETLSGFDWTAEIQKENCGGRRNCYSDDEAEEEEVIIIPATVSCLQARNEVNLWKRRTISPPPPLQINSQA